MINTNLGSLFNMCRPVIEGMRTRKFGRIVNISSINGQKGQIGQANYSAAKAGEIGFTKALAQESAKSGITVNAICPGYIATDMVQAVPKDVLEKSILPLDPARPPRRAGRDRALRCLPRLRRCELHHRLDADRERRPVHGCDVRPLFGLPALRRQLECAKSKPGATVQPTSVHSPSVSAACQACAGTTACGRSPAARSLPDVMRSRASVSAAMSSPSGAPAYQCQTSTASMRCQCERSPRASR